MQKRQHKATSNMENQRSIPLLKDNKHLPNQAQRCAVLWLSWYRRQKNYLSKFNKLQENNKYANKIRKVVNEQNEKFIKEIEIIKRTKQKVWNWRIQWHCKENISIKLDQTENKDSDLEGVASNQPRSRFWWRFSPLGHWQVLVHPQLLVATKNTECIWNKGLRINQVLGLSWLTRFIPYMRISTPCPPHTLKTAWSKYLELYLPKKRSVKMNQVSSPALYE